MGLIPHEAPRLSTKAPVPYPAEGAEKSARGRNGHLDRNGDPSVPRRGFIKLEDTVVVTKDGCEGYGDHGRGWNRGGSTAE